MGDNRPIIWEFPPPLAKADKITLVLPRFDMPMRAASNPPASKNQSPPAAMPAMSAAAPTAISTPAPSPAASIPAPAPTPSPIAMAQTAFRHIQSGTRKRLKTVWLETSGCFGEFVALLNGSDPDVLYWLTQMADVTFFSSIMADQGEAAYQQVVDTVQSGEEYLLIVSGAIPRAEGGHCAVLAKYNGELITAEKAVTFAASKAKEILCVGTCACYGGPTAASPNETQAVDVGTLLNRKVIRAPGCPCHPEWLLGIFAYLVDFDTPPMESDGRPTAFYGTLIHDKCPRRSFFDSQELATRFGQPECMFALGCRGPVTKTLCPFTRWDTSNNWPIGANTTCIGCANNGFPDQMEPFVKYSS